MRKGEDRGKNETRDEERRGERRNEEKGGGRGMKGGEDPTVTIQVQFTVFKTISRMSCDL